MLITRFIIPSSYGVDGKPARRPLRRSGWGQQRLTFVLTYYISTFRAKPIRKAVIDCYTKTYRKLECFIQDAESRFLCTLSTHLMSYLMPNSNFYNSLEQVRQKGPSALKYRIM